MDDFTVTWENTQLGCSWATGTIPLRPFWESFVSVERCDSGERLVRKSSCSLRRFPTWYCSENSTADPNGASGVSYWRSHSVVSMRPSGGMLVNMMSDFV